MRGWDGTPAYGRPESRGYRHHGLNGGPRTSMTGPARCFGGGWGPLIRSADGGSAVMLSSVKQRLGCCDLAWNRAASCVGCGYAVKKIADLA